MNATPGPWNCEPEVGRGAWIFGSDGNWAALACGKDDDTARANKHLIAAAPDMASAIQTLFTCDLSDLPGDVVVMLRSALSKATGA